jgi:hypothetical protein
MKVLGSIFFLVVQAFVTCASLKHDPSDVAKKKKKKDLVQGLKAKAYSSCYT